MIVAGAALFVALGGSAIAASGLIGTNDLATGAVNSRVLINGGVKPKDLNSRTQDSLKGPKGAKGETGARGATGATGARGLTGMTGVPGTDGIVAPFSATNGLVQLPTATPPTVVSNLTVPSGNYVVFAKSEISHTGAGDSVDCTLKAGNAIVDQVAMKTMPALAAIPMSMQAVTVTPVTQFSVECDVFTANGSANYNSLIAIPIG